MSDIIFYAIGVTEPITPARRCLRSRPSRARLGGHRRPALRFALWAGLPSSARVSGRGDCGLRSSVLAPWLSPRIIRIGKKGRSLMSRRPPTLHNRPMRHSSCFIKLRRGE